MDNRQNAYKAYLCVTLVFIAGEFIVLKLMGNRLLPLYHQLYPVFYLSIPSSILQEILFRGYLMDKLRSLYQNPLKVIVINSLLFALAHGIFPQREIIVPLAFLSGLLFATVYYYYPNLLLVSASHVIVNLTVLPFCYFTLISC